MKTAALVSLFAMLSGALAAPIPEVPQVNPLVRCGVPPETDQEIEDVNRIANNLRTEVCERLPNLPMCTTRAEQIERLGEEGVKELLTTIPVAFHVIYDPSTGKGNIPDTMINDQMAALNKHYSRTNFQFRLVSVDRTANTAWFNDLQANEKAIKTALAKNPRTTFQLYTGSFTRGLLGFCQFPWSFPEDSVMHGCMNLYSSLPGGSAAPYNLGMTVSHEVGHGLGLYHTFQGGCRDQDLVADTPAEASATYGCPATNPDTCTAPGLDPIHNYMDYTDDRCMYEFTPGQAARLDQMIATYRPSLLGATERADIGRIDPNIWAQAARYQKEREAAGPKPLLTHEDELAGKHIHA